MTDVQLSNGLLGLAAEAGVCVFVCLFLCARIALMHTGV